MLHFFKLSFNWLIKHMQLLRYYLFVSALFELYAIASLYTGSKSFAEIIPTLPDLQHNHSTLSLAFLSMITLALLRVGLCFDIHNVVLYGINIWVHLVEATLYVGVPVWEGGLSAIGVRKIGGSYNLQIEKFVAAN